MATELQKLKEKCYNKDGSVKKGATQTELARYKQLQDGEPLTKAELAEAEKREAERAEQDTKDFKARQEAKVEPAAIPTGHVRADAEPMDTSTPTASLDPPAEHPRIVQLKDALRIFTQIEAHDSRPDDFVLFTRDVSITAGDVRRARRAMKL